MIGRAAGWILPAAAAVAGILAYRNTRPNPELEQRAREAACGPRSGCVVEQPRPLRIERGPFVHRYDFRTSTGTAVVTCRRSQVLAGAWRCGVDRSRVGAPPEPPGRYPADIDRGPPRR